MFALRFWFNRVISAFSRPSALVQSSSACNDCNLLLFWSVRRPHEDKNHHKLFQTIGTGWIYSTTALINLRETQQRGSYRTQVLNKGKEWQWMLHTKEHNTEGTPYGFWCFQYGLSPSKHNFRLTVRTCAQEMKIASWGADQLWKSYRHVSSSLVSLCWGSPPEVIHIPSLQVKYTYTKHY